MESEREGHQWRGCGGVRPERVATERRIVRERAEKERGG
jgi:hypothetical protein